MVSVFSNTEPFFDLSLGAYLKPNQRIMKSVITLIFLLLSVSGALSAQKLSDLDWMAGYWTSASPSGATMEELWTPSAGNLMLGLHRDVFPNGRSSFEYLRIVNTSEGIVYLASPGGGQPTPFNLKKSEPNRVVFENLNHDFPQRIIYSREGDKLTARIEDESGEKGMQWTWTKASME